MAENIFRRNNFCNIFNITSLLLLKIKNLENGDYYIGIIKKINNYYNSN
jgi:hypothetical protein